MVRLALALLVLALAAPAWADNECTIREAVTRPDGWSVATFWLCDGDHTITECMECDVRGLLGGFGSLDRVRFTLEATTGCASDVVVRGLETPLGMPVVVSTLSIAGQTSVEVQEPRWARFDATVTTKAGCTDVEVLGQAWFRK